MYMAAIARSVVALQLSLSLLVGNTRHRSLKLVGTLVIRVVGGSVGYFKHLRAEIRVVLKILELRGLVRPIELSCWVR